VILWHFLAGSEEKQEIPTSRSQSQAPVESRWCFESEATATFCKLQCWQTERVSVADRPFISFVTICTAATHNVLQNINNPYISIEANDIINMYYLKTFVSIVTNLGLSRCTFSNKPFTSTDPLTSATPLRLTTSTCQFDAV